MNNARLFLCHIFEIWELNNNFLKNRLNYHRMTNDTKNKQFRHKKRKKNWMKTTI